MDELADLGVTVGLIKKQPLFSQLTEKETEELASLLSEKTVKSGEVIVKEGDPVDSIFLIATGKADVRQHGVAQAVASLNPNDAIGLNETGFYSLSGKRTATVVALTDMRLFRLSVTAFHGFSLSHSHVSEIMHKHTDSMMNNES